MKRVVQVGFLLDRTGRSPEALLDAWPTLVAGAAAAARAGWEVTVVQPADRDATLRRRGVDVRFVQERAGARRGPPGLRPVRANAPRLGQAVASLSPDLVHVHGLALPGHARRLRAHLPAGTRILAQDHADRPPRPWRRRGYYRDAAAWDAVTFTVNGQVEPFVRAGALPPDLPVHEVLEASTDFKPGNAARARWDAGVHGTPTLAWVGRLDRNKDPLTVLDGLARATDTLPDPHLWCCYQDAPLLDAVRERVEADPRLAGRVHLLGSLARPAVERLVQGADGLLLGSRREAAGFAVLEAMACGAAPIVTDIPAFRRIVGSVGPRWEPGDPEALAAALRAWWSDPGRPPRSRIVEHFRDALSWDAVGRELDAAYRACLAPRAWAREAVGPR